LPAGVDDVIAVYVVDIAVEAVAAIRFFPFYDPAFVFDDLFAFGYVFCREEPFPAPFRVLRLTMS